MKERYSFTLQWSLKAKVAGRKSTQEDERTYNEKFKSPKKETEKDIKRWKDFSCS